METLGLRLTRYTNVKKAEQQKFDKGAKRGNSILVREPRTKIEFLSRSHALKIENQNKTFALAISFE